MKPRRSTLIVAGAAILLLSAAVVFKSCGREPSTAPGRVLPSDSKEQIIVNPIKNTITIVKPERTDVLHLPDRLSVIDIKQDGRVRLTSKQYGFEHRLFLGINQSDAFRIGAGLDVFYAKKFNLGLGVMGQVGNYTPRVFIKGSYLVYSNAQLGLTLDHEKRVGVMLSIRI